MGLDPGAPDAHWAIASRGPAGEPVVESYGVVRWRERPEAWDEIKSIVRDVDCVCVENQFFSPFRARSASAGSYFRSVREISLIAGMFSAASLETRGEAAFCVGASTWRKVLKPLCAVSAKKEVAREANIRLLNLAGFTPPHKRKKWLKAHHDLAAAIGIALWGLGYESAKEILGREVPPKEIIPVFAKLGEARS